jgi:hypothetical protein
VLAYKAGLSTGNLVNLILMQYEHEEVSRGADPFSTLSNYEAPAEEILEEF